MERFQLRRTSRCPEYAAALVNIPGRFSAPPRNAPKIARIQRVYAAGISVYP
nr:MAG TPA: hypothetical protein [Caudoviricetes sp.]